VFPLLYKSFILLLCFTKKVFHLELQLCKFFFFLLSLISMTWWLWTELRCCFLFCRLRGYSVETAIGVIEDGGRSLKINTQNIRDVSFRVGSIYQFIGELHIEQPNNEVSCLQSLDKTRSFLPNGKSLKLKNIALLERFLDPYNV
jgi:hypothetical protein